MKFKFAFVASQCSKFVVRRDFTKYKDTSKPKANYLESMKSKDLQIQNTSDFVPYSSFAIPLEHQLLFSRRFLPRKFYIIFEILRNSIFETYGNCFQPRIDVTKAFSLGHYSVHYSSSC